MRITPVVELITLHLLASKSVVSPNILARILLLKLALVICEHVLGVMVRILRLLRKQVAETPAGVGGFGRRDEEFNA